MRDSFKLWKLPDRIGEETRFRAASIPPVYWQSPAFAVFLALSHAVPEILRQLNLCARVMGGIVLLHAAVIEDLIALLC